MTAVFQMLGDPKGSLFGPLFAHASLKHGRVIPDGYDPLPYAPDRGFLRWQLDKAVQEGAVTAEDAERLLGEAEAQGVAESLDDVIAAVYASPTASPEEREDRYVSILCIGARDLGTLAMELRHVAQEHVDVYTTVTTGGVMLALADMVDGGLPPGIAVETLHLAVKADLPSDDNERRRRVSALLQAQPTEFAIFCLQHASSGQDLVNAEPEIPDLLILGR